jgi:hypothetical protein
LDLSGLEELQRLDFFLAHTLPELTNVDALAGVSMLAVDLVDLPRLSNLDALAGTLATVDELGLSDLPALTSAQALHQLVQPQRLSLVRTGVTNLDGLQNLESIEHTLVLAENPALSSLAALVGLTGSGNIQVTDNPLLPTCQVESLLARSTWQEIEVSGNDDSGECLP